MSNIIPLDDEFDMLAEGNVVLLRRNGVIIVDHLGHPINYWLVEAATQAANQLRALTPRDMSRRHDLR